MADEPRRLHARHGARALQEGIEKLEAPPRIVVLRVGQRHGHRQDVIGAEARIDCRDAGKTADQQSCADQHDYGQAHLDADGQMAQGRVGGAPDGAARARAKIV
jgi:hypothetical protein